MYKILRMIFGITAAAIAAAAIFIFVYLGWIWGFVSVAACAASFGLCLLFRRLQRIQEERDNPPPARGDFITGPTDGAK